MASGSLQERQGDSERERNSLQEGSQGGEQRGGGQCGIRQPTKRGWWQRGSERGVKILCSFPVHCACSSEPPHTNTVLNAQPRLLPPYTWQYAATSVGIQATLCACKVQEREGMTCTAQLTCRAGLRPSCGQSHSTSSAPHCAGCSRHPLAPAWAHCACKCMGARLVSVIFILWVCRLD